MSDRWEQVDWSMQDTEIARQLNVSRERARVQRQKRGQPLSPHHRQHVDVRDARRALRDLDTADLTLTDVTKELGVSRRTVQRLLREAGKRCLDPREKRTREQIMPVLSETPGATARHVANETGDDAINVSMNLLRLIRRGLVRRTGAGTRVDPYRYWVVPE